MKNKKSSLFSNWRKFLYLLVFILLALAFWKFVLQNINGLNWAGWTGFGEYVSPTGEYYRAKTLWDWLQLLIVPVVIALGAWLLNKNERENERELAIKRELLDRDIALNKQHQDTLESYFDRMSELLLEKELRKAKHDDEVMSIARTRTLAVLRNVDGERKGQVVRFLREANLLSLIGLDNADLSGAKLENIDLSGATLKKANLTHASLINSSLVSSNLQGAKLSYANLTDANLRLTTLLTAIMNNANLEKTNFGEANLSGSNLNYANFTNASLIGANLSGANLSNANFSEAHLSLVKFGDANISGTNFEGAFIRESDLRKVKGITSEQLSKAKSLEKSLLPESF